MTITLFQDPFSQHGYGMDPWMWGWGFHMGWFFLIVMVAFWVAVILAVIFLIRWLVISTRRGVRTTRPEDSALEILRTRYAKARSVK